MTQYKWIAALCALFLLAGCGPGYKVEDGKVYYEVWNEAVGHEWRLMEKADAQTFKILEFEDAPGNYSFGRDKNHLFIEDVRITDVDPATFKHIGDYFYADSHYIYYLGFGRIDNRLELHALKGIERDKFRIIKDPWARAGNILIYGYDTLAGNNIEKFKPIDQYYGKTSEAVIYRGDIVEGADPATFKVIDPILGKAKDKNHRYIGGEMEPEKSTKKNNSL